MWVYEQSPNSKQHKGSSSVPVHTQPSLRMLQRMTVLTRVFPQWRKTTTQGVPSHSHLLSSSLLVLVYFLVSFMWQRKYSPTQFCQVYLSAKKRKKKTSLISWCFYYQVICLTKSHPSWSLRLKVLCDSCQALIGIPLYRPITQTDNG